MQIIGKGAEVVDLLYQTFEPSTLILKKILIYDNPKNVVD